MPLIAKWQMHSSLQCETCCKETAIMLLRMFTYIHSECMYAFIDLNNLGRYHSGWTGCLAGGF
jgi:hypothetical protein